MQKRYDKLIQKLKKSPILVEEFSTLATDVFGLFTDSEEVYEYFKSCGLPLERDGDFIHLKTTNTPIDKEVFCIVDIETNGSKPSRSQIIEIGALKIKNLEIIDRFESLIYCEDIPEYISKITNIYAIDLIEAPMMCDVLRDFRLFLGDSLFVAHNVGFDFGFISYMMKRCNLGELHNRRLCTIDLARKTITAQRYGLSHLNEALAINTEVSHRAYSDALTAAKVLEESLKNLPPELITVEELIDFSLHNKKRKKKKENTLTTDTDQISTQNPLS